MHHEDDPHSTDLAGESKNVFGELITDAEPTPDVAATLGADASLETGAPSLAVTHVTGVNDVTDVTDVTDAASESPEQVPPSGWVTLVMFAAFVVLFGTCAKYFMF